MKSFKPQLESLEDRLVLDGYAGSHALYQDIFIPLAREARLAAAPLEAPAVSGRITGIAVDPSDPSGNTIYVATAGGGVWKTTDGGASFAFDSRPGSGILKSTDSNAAVTDGIWIDIGEPAAAATQGRGAFVLSTDKLGPIAAR